MSCLAADCAWSIYGVAGSGLSRGWLWLVRLRSRRLCWVDRDCIEYTLYTPFLYFWERDKAKTRFGLKGQWKALVGDVWSLVWEVSGKHWLEVYEHWFGRWVESIGRRCMITGLGGQWKALVTGVWTLVWEVSGKHWSEVYEHWFGRSVESTGQRCMNTGLGGEWKALVRGVWTLNRRRIQYKLRWVLYSDVVRSYVLKHWF